VIALVITSVAEPTPLLRELADGTARCGMELIVVGDVASPPAFELAGCDFYGIERQRTLDLAFADVCPTSSYARKNIGYLLAMQRGAEAIVETDDDTIPYDGFWRARRRRHSARVVHGPRWVNVYRYFSDAGIWPRGLPLDEIHGGVPARAQLPVERIVCPIEQGLVDDDPDVDAIYRLVLRLPFRFAERGPVALADGAWCPFNSQNTTWWREAFPLMYLPSSCTFRLTDIWRSFVAQRIAWANGWGVRFHSATVRQLRNEHDLMRDLRDEVPGYLDNRDLCAALDRLDLAGGEERIPDNMRRAYALLVARGWLHERELPLLDAWLEDVASIVGSAAAVA
jgi:hypothetical protein